MLPDLAELNPWDKRMFPMLCSAAAGEGETQPLSTFLLCCGCGQLVLPQVQNAPCLWGVFVGTDKKQTCIQIRELISSLRWGKFVPQEPHICWAYASLYNQFSCKLGSADILDL